MFKDSKAFSGFSVERHPARRSSSTARRSGSNVSEEMGGLGLHLAGGGKVFVYPKDDHVPATFTVLNFPVRGHRRGRRPARRRPASPSSATRVTSSTDEKGIARGDEGPTIAWFKDPAGNILSVLDQ